VNVTENDSAGGQDSFNITIDAGPTEGAGDFLRSGAIEIRRVAISRGDGAPGCSDSLPRRRAGACHSDSSGESARDRRFRDRCEVATRRISMAPLRRKSPAPSVGPASMVMLNESWPPAESFSVTFTVNVHGIP